MKILGAVFVLLVIVLLVWTLTPSDTQVVPLSGEPATHEPASGVTTLEPAMSPPRVAEEPTREAATKPVEPAPVAPVAATKPVLNEGESEIRGRFLVSGGAPAGGVQLAVNGWVGNNERAMRHGTPEGYVNPKGTSEADGRFSIVFSPPRAYQFVLEGSLAGFCKAKWRWHEIEPGKVVDVGDVTLVRGGSVRGRVVDANEKALTSGWMVYGDQVKARSSKSEEPVRVMRAPDGTTGEFLLEGLPEGDVHLKAYSRMANWIEGPTVYVRAGEETRADISYTGPDNSARITVVTFCRPFYVFESLDGASSEIVLTAPGFEERRAKKVERSSQTHSFDDVPPGEYTVEVRDPRCLPWSKSGVRPGTSVDAKLKGNASAVLDVVDDATGEPVPHFALDVRFDNVNFSPSTFRILEAKQDPPRNGVYDGLIPHDQTLLVLADGYAPCEIPMAGLAANEQRRATARLTHGATVRGIVVQGSDKQPRAGVKVKLVPNVGRKHNSFIDATDSNAFESTSDERGAFAFPGIAAGKYTLKATASPILKCKSDVEVAGSGDPPSCELCLPATGTLSGKIIAPEGASFEGLRLEVLPVRKDRPENKEDVFEFFFLPPEANAAIAADGTFRSPPVPAGVVSVTLRCPDVTMSDLNGSSTSEGTKLELGTLELPPDVETKRDFDVRATFPVAVGARVRVNGEARASLVVNLAAKAGPGASSVTDAQGACRAGPVLRGEYRLSVRPLDSSWVYVDPRPIVVGATVPNVDVDVLLVPGTIRCLDAADKRPITNTNIFFAPDVPDSWSSASAKSDNEGRVRISLPPGAWRVLAGEPHMFFAAGTGVLVDWGSGGPSRTEVELDIKSK